MGGDVPFLRPPELATDSASIYDAIFHALNHTNEDYGCVVLLPVTAPLRSTRDIDSCIELFRQRGVPTVVSVTESLKSPYRAYKVDKSGRMVPVVMPNGKKIERRQRLPITYDTNGAVYVGRVDCLLRTQSFFTSETLAYVMPKERSVDIDTYIDLKVAELFVKDRLSFKD